MSPNTVMNGMQNHSSISVDDPDGQALSATHQKRESASSKMETVNSIS